MAHPPPALTSNAMDVEEVQAEEPPPVVLPEPAVEPVVPEPMVPEAEPAAEPMVPEAAPEPEPVPEAAAGAAAAAAEPDAGPCGICGGGHATMLCPFMLEQFAQPGVLPAPPN